MDNKKQKWIPNIPEAVRRCITGKDYTLDNIGMSGSEIHIFDDRVLKIQPANDETENEYQIMQWNAVKEWVPQVLAREVTDGVSYLLMSKIQGKMLCDTEYMKNPALLTKVLADGLKLLWSIDISDCPCDNGLAKKLRMARYNVEHGMVDMDNCEPDTYGAGGFQDPEDLLNWLYEHQPEEELVLSHGDYCLPNIFGVGEKLNGFIDLGKMGKADKWQDIALCYRSLKHKYEGKYGGTYGDFDAKQLFSELGIEPDWEKITYYTLLDELF